MAPPEETSDLLKRINETVKKLFKREMGMHPLDLSLLNLAQIRTKFCKFIPKNFQFF